MKQQLPKLEFDKNRRRVKVCPCGKNNRDGKFVPYVAHEDKGYCHACGEIFLPTLIKTNCVGDLPRNLHKRATTLVVDKPGSFIPFELFSQSLKAYRDNNFIKYLHTIFGEEITQGLIETYYIGTSRHWNGSTVFWQIDKKGDIRGGKIMLYNPESGKRIKDPCNYITWAHHVLKMNDYRLKQCFFGEHLLSHDFDRPVAIAESEKTAIISSVYLPQYIWLAAGSVTNLSAEKCIVLEGRRVVLFPDLNAYDQWAAKKDHLSNSINISISGYLEYNATDNDRSQGLDIADYLIKYNWKDFNVH